MGKQFGGLLLIILGIEVAVLLAICFLMGPQIPSSLMVGMAWTCIVLFTGHLVILALSPGIGVVSMPFLYAASYALYVLGPYILYLSLGNLGLIYYRVVDLDYLTGCLPLIMLSIAAYTFAAVAWQSKPASRRQLFRMDLKFRQRMEAVTQIIALSLIVFSLMVIAFETAQGRGIAPMLEGNYHDFSNARKDGEQGRLFIASITWFLPLASLTYNALAKMKRKRMGFSDLLFFALLGLPLIIGDRGGLIASFAGWLIIHQAICRNITASKLFPIGVAVLFFVPLLEVLRGLSTADISLDVVVDTASNLAYSNHRFAGSTLLSFLGPFSPALMTFMGTLMRIEEGGANLQYGMDYVRNTLAAIPLNSGMAAGNSGQFHQHFFPADKSGPGFMAIGEMYINFHIIGVGMGFGLLGYVTTRLHSTLRAGEMTAHGLAFSGVFFFAILIWIRNESSFVAQICFLWAVLFILFPLIGQALLPWQSKTLRPA